jgi:hypothetical protein
MNKSRRQQMVDFGAGRQENDQIISQRIVVFAGN